MLPIMVNTSKVNQGGLDKQEENDILMEELTRGIDLEKICMESEGKPIPTYKKLAGLVNLGKTYFINFGEVTKVHDWA